MSLICAKAAVADAYGTKNKPKVGETNTNNTASSTKCPVILFEMPTSFKAVLEEEAKVV